MKVAIIGLPQSGKSTVFTAITGAKPDLHGLEPAHAMAKVPDPRMDYLVKLCQPKKVTEAVVEFVDIPGAALDDAKGQEEWRRRLPAVRQCDLLLVVVRDFENASVPAHKNRIDPQSDFAAVWDEIVFADLDAVTTRLDRLEKSLRKPSKSHEAEKREQSVLLKCREALESGKPLSLVLTHEEERRTLSGFAFLTERPVVCACNVSDAAISDVPPLELEHVKASLALCATLEAEIAMLDPADRPAFMKELGIEEPARNRLIRACYEAGGYISFLTMGPDEVRAWTILKGATAVEAAGTIHTDFARGFIRAETVSYDDLVTHTDMKGARAAGKVRKEGKSYVVADGDILHILAGV